MSMIYDVVVVGGGAAGMIAAGRAAELGAKVLLLDKNKQLGVKLLISGKGRCNITNAEDDLKQLINFYGKKGKFLYNAFHNFDNFKVIDFFNNLGLETKVERGKRVFPKSDNARDVVKSLIKFLKINDVEIQLNSEVLQLIEKNNIIQHIILKNGNIINAKKFILTTGGKSYPQTGSTGDAYAWLKKLGHTIVDPKPALTPIKLKEQWVSNLAGLSLKNVEISIWSDSKIKSFFGEALFTHTGMSGPIILNISNLVDLKTKQYITIDFKPALDYQKLDLRIRKDFQEQSSKQFKNSLSGLLPKRLIPLFIKLSQIPENKKVAEISKIERKALLKLFKEMKLTISGIIGYEKAIVTSGGLDLKEINPKTMQSKKYSNLFFAGELIDIDGPTGGYNLQVAWSTGFLAGVSVID